MSARVPCFSASVTIDQPGMSAVSTYARYGRPQYIVLNAPELCPAIIARSRRAGSVPTNRPSRTFRCESEWKSTAPVLSMTAYSKPGGSTGFIKERMGMASAATGNFLSPVGLDSTACWRPVVHDHSDSMKQPPGVVIGARDAASTDASAGG